MQNLFKINTVGKGDQYSRKTKVQRYWAFMNKGEMLRYIAEQASQEDQAICLLRATYRGQLQKTEDKYHTEAVHSPAVSFKETAPKSLRKNVPVL